MSQSSNKVLTSMLHLFTEIFFIRLSLGLPPKNTSQVHIGEKVGVVLGCGSTCRV